MTTRRARVCVFLFNYTDRVALSVAAKPISTEFGLSRVETGYLLWCFLWTHVLYLCEEAGSSGNVRWSLGSLHNPNNRSRPLGGLK